MPRPAFTRSLIDPDGYNVPATNGSDIQRVLDERKGGNAVKKGNPVYVKCYNCQYTTFIEVEPEFTANFTCPRCEASFQVAGSWKPKEIMFLEIRHEIAMPHLCAAVPVSGSPRYYAIWNFIAKVWPDVRNFVEYGHFKYYTPSQFFAIVTNDPEIVAFNLNPEKATIALMSKLRSYDENVINYQPPDIDQYVLELETELRTMLLPKGQAEIKSKTPPRDPIDDLDPASPF